MCTLGDAAALGEGMGSIRARHLNREIQLHHFGGICPLFVAFLFADTYMYC